jgi:UPF0755 protein
MRQFFKTLIGLFVFFITFGIFAAAGLSWWGFQEYTKPGPHDKPVEILVERGTNIGDVADQLSYQNAITYPLIFNIAGRLTGQANKIKAGEYEIPATTSMQHI